MADHIVARQEVQVRMGVQNIDEQTAARHALVADQGKRLALYGHDTWKFHRDRLMALVAIEKRRELATKGEKITDEIIKALVLVDQRVEKFMDATEAEMIEYELNEDAIKGINDTIMRDQGISRHVAGELRIA